ncbi:unnamed protein product (macronuclear) [Paramecium tetraurelia]|uniref:Kelch motif family protein n=1 Tax=Paramecium tetraurelia TaxID=5888 RepID=A0D007_PARTE|nr:uncharacterized protein GSPATT00011948001 [Paramecium tetraurelia]CAK76374.1 unnamed protein product [Paramecium tetraurelia]|eukprot:XP_001443771.1 hypothetical protein (macronuclear) [Paramecium tetraurelia strain d4-2]
MLNQSDINNVENVIQQVIDSLSICRQRIEELHIEKESHDKMKENMDLIKSSQQDFHHIINEYFKAVGENFRNLQSRYPNSEVKKDVITRLDEQIQSLDNQAQKLAENQFTQKDYEYFKQQNYVKFIDDSSKEIDELATYSQKTSKQDQDLLPQVKVNHRVVEGLYLTLNDYASVQWSGDIPVENCHKPIIEAQGGIALNHLIILDERHLQYGLYDIVTNQYEVHQYNSKVNINYSPTVVQGESNQTYLIGGVTQQGLISASFSQLDVNSGQITSLPEMNVKRVGCSSIIIREGDCQYLYVIGGKSCNKVKTKLCERFNFTTQKWEFITKMNHARSNSAIAKHEDYIYVFFGIDSENQNTNVIERYNYANTKTWEIISIQNSLPGFDSSNCSAISINQSQILLLGGIRYSIIFNDQMYFNRKLLTLNTTNSTFSVLDNQLPIDFIPYSHMVIYKNEIYAIGYTMKQVEVKPTLFLDGGFVLKISKDYVKILKYIPAYQEKQN